VDAGFKRDGLMAVPEVAVGFLELLEKSGLLSPEQFAEAVRVHDLESKAAPTDLVETLIAAGVLTRFQADRLLEGRHRGFFIDRYKTLNILGTGGMGWLYLAEDCDTGNRVAVKMLPKKLEADSGMVARFQLEARAGMKLNHPNIVRTYSIDRTEGVYGDVFFVVMELVTGISLEELIVLNGPVDWPQACDFIRQAAAGLQHAHDAGMVHRDVKPANLLVDTSGAVKIIDFGLSHVDPDDEFSLAMIYGHDCLGTADYIAPEQTLDSLSVDGRADIYSLGCTTYATLTGKLPFPMKSTRDKLEAHRTRKPRPLAERCPETPPELIAIVEKMMAKRPENRFEQAHEVCRAMAPFAERRPAQFDFDDVLEKRAERARKRISAKRTLAAGQSGSMPLSAIETTIRREDTRAE